jgi:hypothetical protein
MNNIPPIRAAADGDPTQGVGSSDTQGVGSDPTDAAAVEQALAQLVVKFEMLIMQPAMQDVISAIKDDE